MMPVPRVSVRKRERKPIRPRDGTANSSRTRPEPAWRHLRHLAAAHGEQLRDDADVVLGHVDDQQLDRLVQRAVDVCA